MQGEAHNRRIFRVYKPHSAALTVLGKSTVIVEYCNIKTSIDFRIFTTRRVLESFYKALFGYFNTVCLSKKNKNN